MYYLCFWAGNNFAPYSYFRYLCVTNFQINQIISANTSHAIWQPVEKSSKSHIQTFWRSRSLSDVHNTLAHSAELSNALCVQSVSIYSVCVRLKAEKIESGKLVFDKQSQDQSSNIYSFVAFNFLFYCPCNSSVSVAEIR